MKLLLSLAFAILFSAGQSFAQDARPRVGDERIVLHTNMGDLVLALYPDVAPRHTAQTLKLARMGVYDNVDFYRIEPSFVVQLSDARHRRPQLSPQQIEVISPLKAEFGSLKHRRGVLSMAHYNDAPDSAETSFSVLLSDAPHLDGKYTIFGHLETGEAVLDAISRVERDAKKRPLERVFIKKAEVVDSAEALARMNIQGPIERLPKQSPAMLSKELRAVIVMMIVGGLALFIASGRFVSKVFGSFGLLLVLVGFFSLFAAYVPVVRSSEWLAIVFFLGTVTLFKLMNRFESPR